MNTRVKLAVFVSVPFVIGCTTWQTVPPVDQGAPAAALEGEVRVTHVDGRSYVLHSVRIENDSLIGTNSAGSRITMARNEVSVMDQQRISTKRTAGLVGGTALAIGAVVMIAGAIMVASIF